MSRILENRFVKSVLIYAGIVLVLFVSVSLYLRIYTKHGEDFPVPDFTGLSLEEAVSLAADSDVTVEVVDSAYIHSLAPGAVFHQNPKAGSPVKSGRRILLTTNAVSPKKISMPNVVGYSLRQARSELLARGLKLQHFSYTADIATNNVLKQYYNGAEIEPGTIISTDSKITLLCGLNPHDMHTYVPDVTGLSYSNAESMLYDNSLNVGKVVYDENIVTYQDSLAARVYVQYPSPVVAVPPVDPSDTVTRYRNVSVPRGSYVSVKLGLPKAE